METPSAKVTTQFIVGLVLAVLGYLAVDQSWLGFLPDVAVGPAALVVAAVAAYLKRETNPASSSSLQ